MKKLIFSSVIAIAFLTACGEKPAPKMTADSAAAKTAAVKYQCPMKCEGETTYAEAGICPKCKMPLEEVK